MDDFALTHPEAYDEERLREYEADFTPRAVVNQCVNGARLRSPRPLGSTGGDRGFRFVDGAAGAGVWALEVARVFPNATVLAVELREEEEPHLMRHQRRLRGRLDVIIGDFFSLSHRDMGQPDVLVTNPAFSRFCDYVDRCLEFDMRAWLYAPLDIKMRGEAGAKWWQSRLGYLQNVLVTPGPVGFRGPKTNSDNRVMALWMFEPRPRCLGLAEFELMPWLAGHERKWVTRPGTEQEG